MVFASIDWSSLKSIMVLEQSTDALKSHLPALEINYRQYKI